MGPSGIRERKLRTGHDDIPNGHFARGLGRTEANELEHVDGASAFVCLELDAERPREGDRIAAAHGGGVTESESGGG